MMVEGSRAMIEVGIVLALALIAQAVGGKTQAYAYMPVTSNVLTNVFHIKTSREVGTAFAIDYKGREYLITAYHVVEGIESKHDLAIWIFESASGWWKKLDITDVVGVDRSADIAVLACADQLSQLHLEAATSGMYGQEVILLGFPLNFRNHKYTVPHLHLPLIQQGINNGVGFGTGDRALVSGHVVPGFSGGPVVSTFDVDSEQWVYKVIGVIIRSACLKCSERPAFNGRCSCIEGSGFAVVSPIKGVVDLIDDYLKKG